MPNDKWEQYVVKPGGDKWGQFASPESQSEQSTPRDDRSLLRQGFDNFVGGFKAPTKVTNEATEGGVSEAPRFTLPGSSTIPLNEGLSEASALSSFALRPTMGMPSANMPALMSEASDLFSPRKIVTGAMDLTSRALRSGPWDRVPGNQFGELRPLVRALAGPKIFGGPQLLDAIVPERPDVVRGLFTDITQRSVPKQKVAPVVDPFSAAVKEHRASWIPNRMPKSAPDALFSPTRTSTNTGGYSTTPLELPPEATDLFSPQQHILPESMKVKATPAEPPIPLRPFVGTPEEWAAYDQKMNILKPEASDAGTYHAARGSAKAKFNLQQRIGKKLEK